MKKLHWKKQVINTIFHFKKSHKKSSLLDPINLKGYFDGILPTGELFGWAYDKNEPLRRITVHFTVDGTLIGQAKAGQYREDLAAADKSDGCCGFVFAKLLPEAINMLKPDSAVHAFFDPDKQHELPNSPLQLTGKSADKLYFLALDSAREDLPLNGKKLAMLELLNALPQFDNNAEALRAYQQILGFSRLLLQLGEHFWLQQSLMLATIQERCDLGLPAFALILFRTIASNARDELSKAELALLEIAFYAELRSEKKPAWEAAYLDVIRETMVWCYRDSHFNLLNKPPLSESSCRFLSLLSLALCYLYNDYPFASNVVEVIRRNTDISDNALLLEHCGKMNSNVGKHFEALQDFTAAIKAGSQAAWVFQETAVLQVSLCEGRTNLFRQRLPEILALFFTSFQYSPQRGSTLQHLADKVLRSYFQNCTDYTAQMAKTGDINSALAERRQDMQALIAALNTLPRLAGHGYYQGTATPDKLPSRCFRHILFVGSKDLWQCYQYRVVQKMEQAHTLGLQTAYRDIDSLDDDSWKNDMVFTDAVYICRVPAVFTVCKLIAYARQLHIPVIYDIDDYLFDERYFPAPLESYAGTIDEALHTHLIMDNPFFEYALLSADHITCSTPPLAEKITAVVGPGKPVAVHPNLLSPKLYQAARQPIRPEKNDDSIEIFYGSATKAHKQVIYEVFGPALKVILQRYPRVKFTAFGYFQLPTELMPYADRIEFREPTSNRNFYLKQLSAADINIAALEQDPFTDCKSEIKWLEAAVYGIPSVVTPTATYLAALTPGLHVLFATDSKEWTAQLTRLIESPALRRNIGKNARHHAVEHFNPTVGAKILDCSITSSTKPASAIPIKPCLLYVNVWFAPQAVGGATRVFESHVRFLMENYAEDYEVQVLTTHINPENFAPYSVEQFFYGTVLVTRLNVPLRDWSETQDQEVYAFCLDFFFKQRFGLIHFHALPVMTASPVDAARKLDIPYVITLHDGWWLSKYMFLIDDSGELIDPHQAFAKPEQSSRQQQLFDCLDDARALLAVSDKFRDIYAQAGISQTQTNENGLELFKVLPRTRTPDTSPPKIRIAHIGGMSNHKGFHLFREAVSQTDLNHIEVHIIDHSLELGESYQGQWGNTPVIFRAKYKQSDISIMYASMDVLVAPSVWPEAYGLVTREAAYAGVWVIASDRGAVGDCVEEGVNGRIVSVENALGLQQALQEIDSNPEKFLVQCPQKTPRTVAEQVKECVSLYQAILKDVGQNQIAY